MPQGTIVILNHQRGMYAVQLTDGSYSVFELLDSNEVNEGDVISGPMDEHGGCSLRILQKMKNLKLISNRPAPVWKRPKKGCI